MAQEGTPDKSSDASATEVSQIIFGGKNLKYQIEQFLSSGGQTVNRDLKQTTTATATRTWENKRSNWQNNSSAHAF